MDSTMRSFLIVCLSMLALAPSAGALGSRDRAPALTGEARQGWSKLLDEGEEAGIPRDRLEIAAARLDGSGLTPDEAQPAFLVAYEAARSGLPAGGVLLKIEEGALKRVDGATLAQAAEARFQVLRQARDLLGEAGHGTSPAGGLGMATALALESGLPASALRPALERGADKPAGQVKAVVEAGEALHLEGLDPETVAALMVDALERNLRRPELLRVVRYAAERRRDGMDGMAIRQSLWAGEGTGPARAPGAGSAMGSRGAEAGGGRGLGAPPGSAPGAGGRPPRGGHR